MKTLKRAMALIFVFILSFNTFAVTVSDNDGSAFITKAEFDSLKNAFQNQIDQYNTSIDSKIDSAIAAYLSGIVIQNWKMKTKLCDATKWTFMHSADYPKYGEGMPFVHGNSFRGNARYQTSAGGQHNTTWIVIDFPGVSNYKNNEDLSKNGGFKKHYISKPSNNAAKNGSAFYVAEYNGYYEKEGEDIVIGGYTADINSAYWAANGEKCLHFGNENVFSNLAVPATAYTGLTIYGTPGTSEAGYCTGTSLVIQAASRMAGKKTKDEYVSIYDDIDDKRFYDTDTVNKIGITSTSTDPNKDIVATKKETGLNDWLEGVLGVGSVKYASFCVSGYNTTTGYYPSLAHNNSYSYSIVYNAWNDHPKQSMLKLANDTHNLVFKHLWTANTNSAALKTETLGSAASTKTSIKNNIKKALIYDKDGTVHLSLGAGYPLLEVKKDQEIKWTVTSPNAGTYSLIAKYGPFDPTTDALSQADVEFENGTAANKKIFTVNGNGASNEVKFKVIEDGIIFLKWATSGFGGGAEFDVSASPYVKDAER